MRHYAVGIALVAAALVVSCRGPHLSEANLLVALEEGARAYLIQELQWSTDLSLAESSQTLLRELDSVLRPVHDRESARGALPRLVLVVDRATGIATHRVSDHGHQEAEARRALEAFEPWSEFQANLRRLHDAPEAVVQLEHPLRQLHAFFRARS